MPKGQRGTVTHGVSGYSNGRCRCDICHDAYTAWRRARYGHRPREVVDAERAAQHGTESKYTSGCRCGPCTFAASEARRERRSVGTINTHNAAGYKNGCRCDICRVAHTTASREFKRQVRATA